MPFSCKSCVQSNRKVGFIGMKFQFNFQVLTKFHNICTKSLFCFRKKDQKTLSTCQKKTAVINVLIFNKLDFQNCFLPFLTLKLYTNIKSLSKSQFWKCLFYFPLLKLFAENPNRCKSPIRAIWLFLSENRKKWIFYITKLSKNTEARHSFGKWPRLA